jgi:2-polyprenyl-3-methyl-5-hydroxy-6-metoxy-1,4-benzoquinol methylase
VAEGVALMKVRPEKETTETFENEGVRVRSVENCLLCGRPGLPLYTGLRDRLFAAPGEWSLFRCRDCSLVWLDPQPIPEDVFKLYRSYPTHRSGAGKEPDSPSRFLQKATRAIGAATLGYDQLLAGPKYRWVGRMASLITPWKDRALGPLMHLEANVGGRLLDVGCGNGAFLATMRDLGWDVMGVEPDPEAVAVAVNVHKLPVIAGTLEEAHLPAASFDAISMYHVIEHVPDAIALMAECRRILKPGGRVVMLTPNAVSLGHRLFHRSWRGLEPPRHLFLFSVRSLARATEEAGLSVSVSRTSSVIARFIWLVSQSIRDGHPRYDLDFTRASRRQAWLFWGLEEILRVFWTNAGEEILLVARKPNPGPEKGENHGSPRS